MYLKKFASINLIVIILLLTCLVNGGFSIKCYVCSSLMDDDCANPKENTPANTCISNEPASLLKKTLDPLRGHSAENVEFNCLKLIEETNVHKVTRVCVEKTVTCDEIKSKSWKEDPNLKDITCSICDSDLCNSSNNLKIGLSSVVASIVTFFAIYNRLNNI